MSTKKQITKSEWQDRLQLFTSGNRNREASIQTGGETLVEKRSLTRVDYDPEGKGNDIMITLSDFGHTIKAPDEMHITENENGVVTELEIVDKEGVKTILSF